MVKIIYIWHDCFVVETPHAILVFDYWLDEDGESRDIPLFHYDTDPELPVYVFVSHFHKDHYNPAIFGWQSVFPDIHYVVSPDVWKRMRHIVSPTSVYKGPKVDPKLVVVLRNGQTYEDDVVKASAFPSTDIGNSYLVETGGRRIFHAGDLNCWAWREESTPAEVNKAESDFSKCLDKIAGCLGNEPIDYCFFPVDSRIGLGYPQGASVFVRRFKVMRFFPMHFALGDAAERERRAFDAVRFEMYANPDRGEYIPLCTPGTSYYNFS